MGYVIEYHDEFQFIQEWVPEDRVVVGQSIEPCPFCGKQLELDDEDVLHPNGRAWTEFDHGGDILRSYTSSKGIPEDQWCYSVHCPVSSGGCGAEISGDSRAEALEKWNTRA